VLTGNTSQYEFRNKFNKNATVGPKIETDIHAYGDYISFLVSLKERLRSDVRKVGCGGVSGTDMPVVCIQI
jgi:hypothetical protein